MQLFKKGAKIAIKLLQRENKAIDEVVDLAETISVQSHKAAEAAKEVLVAVKKLKEALADEPAAAA